MGCTDVSCLNSVLDRLDEIAPGVPLLALGQTIFWDEPMKAGVAMALRKRKSGRRFIAGVHDTDYFAKITSEKHRAGQFKTLPHNDTTTKGFWSAAGEFSALFGSETVVTREALQQGGLRFETLRHSRPGYLDEATEAWGWRGIASLDEHPPVTADVPVRQILPSLKSTFSWALETSLQSLTGEGRVEAEHIAEGLQRALCDAADESTTVSDLYKRLTPLFYGIGPGTSVDIDVAATTEILRFNRETASLPRFRIVDVFVKPSTRWIAAAAYDEAVKGSGLYGLSRFGTGAIPFDLFIPGLGRGTVRVGNRGIVIQTHRPQFISLKKPIQSVAELAGLIEDKFGPNCTLVGKAVALIGMLSTEFVFVFHEGASGYVRHSRTLHQKLREQLPQDFDVPIHPILRLQYQTWDALRVTCTWFRLPEPFQYPFGTEEMCSPSLGTRWREVAQDQQQLLEQLGKLKRPIELIEFLDSTVGGSWKRIAEEYRGLHGALAELHDKVENLRAERHATIMQLKELKRERGVREKAKGDHFRARIFEKEPTAEDLAQRELLTHEVEDTIHTIRAAKRHIHDLAVLQKGAVSAEPIARIHERRRAVELEAELKRARLIRQAIITSKGLQNANSRPSAWWFRLVSPDGLWFRETVETAHCYLEDLV